MFYKFLDNADIWFEVLPDKLIEIIKWYFSQMTALYMLLIIMTISILGLAWLALSDRKKYMSRAFWRGFEKGKRHQIEDRGKNVH